MATIDKVVNIDDANATIALEEAADKLESAGGELVLDFSSLRRLDSSAARAIERLADTADTKSVKVTLRSVNVDVYKTLKLMKLTHRFSFLN